MNAVLDQAPLTKGSIILCIFSQTPGHGYTHKLPLDKIWKVSIMKAMNNIRIYQVGGSVRDEIMGVPSNDIDYAVEAPSYNAMRDYIVNERGGHIFLENPEFVTIRARIGKVTSDFVLCRKDGAYSDGRHPDTITAGTIYDDLARRDFTMNAIAKDEDGNYIDPFNGIADIEERVIRCVGRAEDRIREDYLRLLRAARFAITKDMAVHIDIRRMFADREVVSKLRSTVSQDRIRQELGKMFAYDTPATIQFFGYYYDLSAMCFADSIWLKPTSEKR